MTDHYEALGVDKNAGPEEIKAAFRRAAQRAHPDKEGGSAEKFYPIRKAYEVLSDRDRRARYDRTGADDEQPIDSIRQEAMGALAGLFLQGIEALDVDHVDLVGAVRNAIAKQEQTLEQNVRQFEAKIGKLERAHRRLVRKGRGMDTVGDMLKREIDKGRDQLKDADRERERFKIMRSILAQYAYRADAAAGTTTTTTAFAWIR